MCKKTVTKMVTRGRGGLHSVSSDFHLVLSSWCEIVQKQRSHINKIRLGGFLAMLIAVPWGREVKP